MGEVNLPAVDAVLRLAEARAAVREAEQELAEAHTGRLAAIEHAKAVGLTHEKVREHLGISMSRLQQLLRKMRDTPETSQPVEEVAAARGEAGATTAPPPAESTTEPEHMKHLTPYWGAEQ